MARSKPIRAIVVVCDENEHISRKTVGRKSRVFVDAFREAFPESSGVAEVIVTGTESPIFHAGITGFVHDGELLSMSTRANKDLALVMYCTAGFTDQDGDHHYLLDNLWEARAEGYGLPSVPDGNCLVVFLTTDRGSHMRDALQRARHTHRVTYLALAVGKDIGQGDDRLRVFGRLAGANLRSICVAIESDGIVLDTPDVEAFALGIQHDGRAKK